MSTSFATRTTTTSTAPSGTSGRPRSGDRDEAQPATRDPSDEVEIEDIYTEACEFPQHDWRLTASAHRYGYMAGSEEGEHRSARSSRSTTNRSLKPPRVRPGPRRGRADLRAAPGGRRRGRRLAPVRRLLGRGAWLTPGHARRARRETDRVAVAHLRHHVPLGFHGTFTERVAASPAVMYHAIVKRLVKGASARAQRGRLTSMVARPAPDAFSFFAGRHALGGTRHSARPSGAGSRGSFTSFPRPALRGRRIGGRGRSLEHARRAWWLRATGPGRNGEPYDNAGCEVVGMRWGRVT